VLVISVIAGAVAAVTGFGIGSYAGPRTASGHRSSSNAHCVHVVGIDQTDRPLNAAQLWLLRRRVLPAGESLANRLRRPSNFEMQVSTKAMRSPSASACCSSASPAWV
jgi:hypothetical protein